MEKVKLILGVKDRPKLSLWIFLSFQHVFAMFGATILVPLLTGLPVSVALFTSGLGTLIYIFFTKAEVPVYLGSSFAYITATQIAIKAMGGNISAAQSGIFLVGIIYVIVAILLKFIGKKWIQKLLPPVVIGPMIAVIGLGLASTAVKNSDFIMTGDIKKIIVAIITFLIAAFISTNAKGFFKIIPFLCAIGIGYIVSLLFNLVDLSTVSKAEWFSIPDFKIPFASNGWNFYFGPEALAILPIALVTISEHIGDHLVLSQICGENFLQNPGLDRTLLGDGVATSVSALLGGPANTTYGENTAVIGMTKIASIYVIAGAAVIAIIISFIGKISAIIHSIPTPVIGGMSILLYGVIASNGLRILIHNNVDFSKQKNLVICSAMLVIGLGGAVLNIPLGITDLTLSGTALSAIIGVSLNLILPTTNEDEKKTELNTL